MSETGKHLVIAVDNDREDRHSRWTTHEAAQDQADMIHGRVVIDPDMEWEPTATAD